MKQIPRFGRDRVCNSTGPLHLDIRHHRRFHGGKQLTQGFIHFRCAVYRGVLAPAPARGFPEKMHIWCRTDGDGKQTAVSKSGTDLIEQGRFIADGPVRHEHHLLHMAGRLRAVHSHRQ